LLRIIKIPVLFVLRAIKRPAIVKSILNCSPKNWREAILWAFSNIVGSFMPIWGAFFLLRLHRTPFLWVDFASHGEFGIYAAAFLAPAIYQILKSIRKDKFPLKTGSVLLALFGILMAAFIYAGTNPQFAANASVQRGTIDEKYLMRMSGTLLFLAFAFSFLVTLMDTVSSEPDLGYADRVNQAFLQAEITVDQPGLVSDIADLSTPNEDAIPSSEELKQQFSADRATGEDTDG
jgi:hypothetical protein